MNKSQHSPRLKCKGTDNAVPNLVEQVEVEDKSKSREQKLHFETASSAYKRGISEEKARWNKKIVDWAKTYKLDKKLEWMLEVLLGDAE